MILVTKRSSSEVSDTFFSHSAWQDLQTHNISSKRPILNPAKKILSKPTPWNLNNEPMPNGFKISFKPLLSLLV